MVNEEVKLALKKAILKCLPVFHQLSERYQEPYQVWRRHGGGWRSEYQRKPCLRDIFTVARNQVHEAGSDFVRQFFSNYPEYGEGKLVGCSGLVSMQLSHDNSQILNAAIDCLWDRHGTFDCNEDDIDVVVTEFADFIDLSTIRVRFQSQLQNYQMDESSIGLPGNLTIRKLTEREISAFHGGSLVDSSFRRRDFLGRIHEFTIEGECDGAKILGSKVLNANSPIEIARSQFEKAILCLRTFKEGHVGYDWMHFKFVKFCPLNAGSYGSLHLNVPPGVYKMSSDEIAAFHEHARNIFGLSEPALKTACARLSDAEMRFRPQDQILDAVIGMEAILLSGLGKEDRRSELKYRFSLNYSTLSSSPEERWRAYNVAKNLYDLRSTIAHGGDLPDKGIRIGDEKLTSQEAARRAKEVLRLLIKHFLPQAKAPPYKNPNFWERAYFGLSDSKD